MLISKIDNSWLETKKKLIVRLRGVNIMDEKDWNAMRIVYEEKNISRAAERKNYKLFK